MNVSDWPEELCVFEGDFAVVDGDIDNAEGFGRIWVRSSGNHLPQQFSLKLGSAVLRIAAFSQTIGSEFLSFVIADKGWIAKIRSIQNDCIRLSLTGFFSEISSQTEPCLSTRSCNKERLSPFWPPRFTEISNNV